jgi:hypothetical protein
LKRRQKYIQEAFSLAVAYLYTVIPVCVAVGGGILKMDPLLLTVSFLSSNKTTSEDEENGSFITTVPFIMFRVVFFWICMLELIGMDIMCTLFEMLYPKHLCNVLRLIEADFKSRRTYMSSKTALFSHGMANIQFMRRYRKVSTIVEILNPGTSTLALVSTYMAGATLVLLNFMFVRLAFELPLMVLISIASGILCISVAAFYISEGWAQIMETSRGLRSMWKATGRVMLSRKYMQLTEKSLKPISHQFGFMGFNFGVLDRSFMIGFISTTVSYTIAALLEIPAEGRA